MIVNWAPPSVGAGWNVEPDAVVWVDLKRVEASFAAGDQYVGPGGSGQGQATRYANIGRHFLSGVPIGMPHIALRSSGEIRFTDGRHRFAWLRDHGALALPVTIDPARAAPLKAGFGSPLTSCEFVASS